MLKNNRPSGMNKNSIIELEKIVAAQSMELTNLKTPLEFKMKANRPTMFVKLGDPDRGVMPSDSHALFVQRQLKEAKVDDHYNIIINTGENK